jgi:hypothetical protein
MGSGVGNYIGTWGTLQTIGYRTEPHPGANHVRLLCGDEQIGIYNFPPAVTESVKCQVLVDGVANHMRKLSL